MKQSFSVFSYDFDQQILSHNKVPIEITKKNHELLQHFLHNPNRLISRDELIDHVWHGRVVTNNTIDQCILKLRKALNQVKEGEYIESVYGQGVRFLPPIHNESNHTSTRTTDKKYLWVGLLIMSSLVYVGYVFLSDKQINTLNNLDQAISKQKQAQTVPDKKPAKDDWLLNGGSYYLSHLLNQYPNIKPQKIRKNKASENNTGHLMIDLIQKDQSIQLLQIDFSQHAKLIDGKNKFHATLTLYVDDKVKDKTEIKSELLVVLFPEIAAWVAGRKETTEPNLVIDEHIYTANEAALQDYFRGASAQAIGDSQLAIEYFNKAVELDPEFKMAWYEMAVALRNHADPKKAISILNAIHSNDQLMSYRVALVKAQCYAVAENLTAAADSYEVASQIAESINEPAKMAAVYISQSILYIKLSQYEQAEQLLQQAITLTDKSSQPHMYGTMMNTYTSIASHMNRLPLAIEKSQLAIEAFQISGDVRYQMHAKTRLAGLLTVSNEFNQAELLVKESLFHAEQLNHRRGISDNRTKLAIIYQATGRFVLAEEQWQAVIALSTELNLYSLTGDAYIWLVKLHLADRQLDKAVIDLKLLEQLVSEHADVNWKQRVNAAKIMLALYLQDKEEASRIIEQAVFTSTDESSLFKGDLARLNGDFKQAESQYLGVAEKFTAQGRLKPLTEVMNRLNELYLTYETQNLTASLRRTSHLKPFIYPFQKHQAQAAANEGNAIKALSLMEEVKFKSNQFWQATDQELLEQMKETASIFND